ncbi:hypothetical protein GCM10016455_29610 [Aliiroseovarius zhejiangensis]|uniref:O-antigen ligase n=1 Tax=Aliiroseovarius zhejiangensis TaxID=1632025 RepID=A0ABQ3J7E0_9RHOB|nr:hypothetical protein GCM10016455_29610 [Aliiroseovarius zhejiangensis]
MFLGTVFLISLLLPMRIRLGPLLLFPYRLWLLLLFIPLLIALLRGKAGPVAFVDWCFFGAAIWAVVSLLANHPLGVIIEPAGAHTIEFLGAYLLGRITIRSAEDFHRMVRIFFMIVLVLLPFALLEGLLHRPVLLQLIGQNGVAVDIGTRMGLRRAQTAFEHPILFGSFVSAGLGLVWYSYAYNRSAMRRLFGTFVIGLSTMLSLSSGALMAFAMQTVFIAWEWVLKSYKRRWAIFGWGAAAVYVLIDLFTTASPFHVLVRYATFSMQSSYNRILIWHYGTQNIWDNPLFGLGLNDWVRPRWMSASVDNFWLLIALRYGIPFFILVTGALVLLIWRMSRAQMPDPADRAARAAFLTTFGGVALAAGTVHYWNGVFSFIMFLIGSSIWMISGGLSQSSNSDQSIETDHRKSRRAAGLKFGDVTNARSNNRPKT